MVSIKRNFYKIYDLATLPGDAYDILRPVIQEGVDWLQYRNKRPSDPNLDLANQLCGSTHAAGADFIVDNCQLALDLKADDALAVSRAIFRSPSPFRAV